MDIVITDNSIQLKGSSPNAVYSLNLADINNLHPRNLSEAIEVLSELSLYLPKSLTPKPTAQNLGEYIKERNFLIKFNNFYIRFLEERKALAKKETSKISNQIADLQEQLEQAKSEEKLQISGLEATQERLRERNDELEKSLKTFKTF